MALPRVEVKTDNIDKVLKALTALVNQQILVGIPETMNHREDDPINNAQIGYAMEFGVPSHNVPARPSLIPGVEDAKERALRKLKAAADATMQGLPAIATQFLNQAGQICRDSVRRRINSNLPPPLKPGTIRARKYARGTKSRRKSERLYMALIAQGMEPGDAQSEAGIKSLVNTGQFRNSMTYVIRKRK